MTRKGGTTPRALAPINVACVFCKATATGTVGRLHEAGWHWFTGYNPARTDVCPDCAKSREGAMDELRFKAYTPPPQGNAYTPREGSSDAKRTPEA